MAVEYDANGTPILTNDSLISDVPPYTQALAAASIMPVGAIMPYMGTAAPNYWLFCDGSEYDPADLPELYAVNGAFHADDAPGEFRVPDLRGRSPIGVASGLPHPVCDVALGERAGDSRVPHHIHGNSNNGAGGAAGTDLPGVGQTMATMSTGAPEVWKGAGWAGENGIAGAPDIDPHTGVNFIVYAGRPTVGISPLSELAPVTTRMMIEARLAEKGIGEEEIKMLKEQLATLKENHAK